MTTVASMMRRHIYRRYAANDLTRNRAVTVALVLVLVVGASLMATGAMVIERVVGSTNRLFDEAKPPHVLQMHTGDHDRVALAGFASRHPEIDAWHVQEMLGYDGTVITWERPETGASGDLADSLIDNLFVTQNSEFDLLLDDTGAVPAPAAGEVYVPVAYQERFELQVGDQLGVRTNSGTHDLRVRGFVRDAQMASSLSSATRFLVAETDLRELERAGGGASEIIVAYRLADPSLIADLQRAYESDEALPKNGQAVTFPMIRIINAVSDGLVAAALVLMSLLLVAIALLNVRFVIRGTLEDEVREIGAMKAMGIPNRTIRGLYLTKYRVMAAVACVIGGMAAVAATEVLTRSMRVNYAEAPVSGWTILVPVLALAGVYGFVVAMCRGILARVNRIEVVAALVHGSTSDERRTARPAARQARGVHRARLISARGGGLTRRLVLNDLRAERRQWVLIPVVFLIAAVVVTLPTNLLTTFQDPRVVTYMGAPESDLRVDLPFSDEVDASRAAMVTRLHGDDRLTNVRDYAHMLYEADGVDGWETMRVEVGDYSAGTIEFLQGERPGPDQIALSVLNANAYDRSIGDELAIRRGDQTSTVVVSGIYQDVTSGGHTAKMHGEVTTGAAGYVIYADVIDDGDAASIASEYRDRFPAAVIPMREYLDQTLSYVTDGLRRVAIASLVVAIGVAVLITMLFLQLKLRRDRSTMGVMSAIGFSTRELVAQVRAKTLLAVLAGTLAGLVLTVGVGASLVGAVISMSGLGIAALSFIPNPWLVYLTYPLMLIAAGHLGAVVVTARLRGADTSAWLTR